MRNANNYSKPEESGKQFFPGRNDRKMPAAVLEPVREKAKHP
jgi:hypothetical protein